MVDDNESIVSLSSSESAQSHVAPSHLAAGEALRMACQLVLDDLTRREQSPLEGEQCPSSYLDKEERGMLEGVVSLGLAPLRRLAALAGRKWPKWHLSEPEVDDELFTKGYIYHTGLSPRTDILHITEPDPLLGFQRIGWAPEKALWGKSLMDNLLESLDRKALVQLSTRLGLPTTGRKGQLLKAILSEFNGRQRRLGDDKVLDMSAALSQLQHPPYVRLRVTAVRALAAMTALVEVMGAAQPSQPRVPGATHYKLPTLPVSLVLSMAGQFRTAFPNAVLSTVPWLWNREEYELIQVASYGSHLYDCGARSASELGSLGRAIKVFIGERLEAITVRLEGLEAWQRRLTCWYRLVSVVWHSVWALERVKQWEEAVVILLWLLQDIPSILHSPSRVAKYLNRLRIDYGHVGKANEFKGILGSFLPTRNAVEDLDSSLPVAITIPEPERRALLGEAHPDIVINEYHIVKCGANRSYGWVEAATLDHIGWTGVHDEGGLVRRLMVLLLWEDLVKDAIHRGTVVTPCQGFPGDIYVEGYLDRAPGVKARLEEISAWEPHLVAMEVLRASEAIERWSPVRFLGLKWTENRKSSSSPSTSESSTSADPWSPESAATLAQCLGGVLLARLFTRILSDMAYWGGGMPDLTIWQGQHARFVEVKGPGDELSARQRGWIAELMRCGADAEVAYIVEPGKQRSKKRKKK